MLERAEYKKQGIKPALKAITCFKRPRIHREEMPRMKKNTCFKQSVSGFFHSGLFNLKFDYISNSHVGTCSNI